MTSASVTYWNQKCSVPWASRWPPVNTQHSPRPPVAFTSSYRASERQLTSTEWVHAHGIDCDTGINEPDPQSVSEILTPWPPDPR